MLCNSSVSYRAKLKKGGDAPDPGEHSEKLPKSTGRRQSVGSGHVLRPQDGHRDLLDLEGLEECVDDLCTTGAEGVADLGAEPSGCALDAVAFTTGTFHPEGPTDRQQTEVRQAEVVDDALDGPDELQIFTGSQLNRFTGFSTASEAAEEQGELAGGRGVEGDTGTASVIGQLVVGGECRGGDGPVQDGCAAHAESSTRVVCG